MQTGTSTQPQPKNLADFSERPPPSCETCHTTKAPLIAMGDADSGRYYVCARCFAGA